MNVTQVAPLPMMPSNDETRPQAVLATVEPTVAARTAMVTGAAVPASAELGEWVSRNKAAKALGVSPSSVARKALAGVLPVRVDEQGQKLYRVPAAVAKAMIEHKQRTDEGARSAAIVRLIHEGKPIEVVCAELRVEPRAVAATIGHARAAREAQMLADEQQRAYEVAHGDSRHPTTWAWVAMRKDSDFDAVSTAYETWKRMYGGKDSLAAPMVLRALESRVAWDTAIARWKAEVAIAKGKVDLAESLRAAEAARAEADRSERSAARMDRESSRQKREAERMAERARKKRPGERR